MRIVVTGAGGFLGWHAAVRLHARNCANRYLNKLEDVDLVLLDRSEFATSKRLREVMRNADAVLHFAGVNRGSKDEVESGNPKIATELVRACRDVGAMPHIIYANSTHASSDTPYGRSKRRAGEILEAFASRYTDLVLPHIFGECARPNYNSVTATFIDRVIGGGSPPVDPKGEVQLLHAGVAAEVSIQAALKGLTGCLQPESRCMTVPDLCDRIIRIHASYSANLFPDLSDDFELALFNTYRAALYPHTFPRQLKLHTDRRGTLFEAIKGGGGGQTFLSWTERGMTRGDHFHLGKVERFLVLQGQAIIRIRRVLSDLVWEFPVGGDVPAVVDMPTLHTHSIENVGNQPLLTMFWSHEVFDSSAPDTYADPVLRV